jgi:hypothetical protein
MLGFFNLFSLFSLPQRLGSARPSRSLTPGPPGASCWSAWPGPLGSSSSPAVGLSLAHRSPHHKQADGQPISLHHYRNLDRRTTTLNLHCCNLDEAEVKYCLKRSPSSNSVRAVVLRKIIKEKNWKIIFKWNRKYIKSLYWKKSR